LPDQDRQKMVGWYDPGQLLRTAGEVIISTIFGRNADQRVIEAMFAGSHTVTLPDPADPRLIEDGIEDYSDHQELWIDYVADLGDGWDSTYSVAYNVSRPTLSVNDAYAHRYDTERGDILIFGGDEVYPTASQLEYKRRTLTPYDCAFQDATARPDLYAIPGNHDWYDSLVAFTRYFISKGDVDGFRTRQCRSYFALKLPHGWWLLGLDVQLGSYVDGCQVTYFEQVAKHIGESDSVIMCNAEPVWIYDHLYKQYDPNMDDRNLDYVEKVILKGKSVRVFLAGDQHHYRRHAAQDGTQKITAGGGGAFLHPTHLGGAFLPKKLKMDVTTIQETFNGTPGRIFDLQQSWPTPEVSAGLCWRNLLFPVLNWKFGIVPASLYLLTAWSVMADIGHIGLFKVGAALLETVETALNQPLAVFWAAVIFIGFWLFTDTHSKWYRRIAGPIHGFSHVLAMFFLGWGAAYFAVTTMHQEFKSIPQLLVSGGIIFVGGWIIGSSIVGCYLLISLNGFGRHGNEAFSSLRIKDWKHFLRLRIDRGGTLTIFPIGIRGVVRQWDTRKDGISGFHFVPPEHEIKPELIEGPITVMHRPPSGAPCPKP
jgi:hypothetical protein